MKVTNITQATETGFYVRWETDCPLHCELKSVTGQELHFQLCRCAFFPLWPEGVGMPSRMIATICSLVFVLLPITRVLHADIIVFSADYLGTDFGGDSNRDRFLDSELPPSLDAIPVSGVNVSIGMVAGTNSPHGEEDIGILELFRDPPGAEVLVEFLTSFGKPYPGFGCDEEVCREVFPGAPNLLDTILLSDTTLNKIEFIPTPEPRGIVMVATLIVLMGGLRFGRTRINSWSN